MRFVGMVILALMAGATSPASASRWREAEIRALPDYCQARISSRSAEQYNNWRTILGPDFEHMHHYCYGLAFLNRYYGASDALEKKRILQSASSNFTYVLQRADRSFRILPEIYVNMGTVLSLQNRQGEALQAMRKAIELDPKMAKAYTATANLYEKMKKKNEALETATEGLRQIPGNAPLQRLYVKLGGQLPYPEPAAPPVQRAEEANAGESRSASGAEAAQADAQAANPAAPAAQKAVAESVPANAEAAVPPAPKIGSPSNPWCRFCPPEPGQ